MSIAHQRSHNSPGQIGFLWNVGSFSVLCFIPSSELGDYFCSLWVQYAKVKRKVGLNVIYTPSLRFSNQPLRHTNRKQPVNSWNVVAFWSQRDLHSAQALENFDAILEESDGIMVARGDLGVEIPFATVTRAQKLIVERTNRMGKPSMFEIDPVPMQSSLHTNDK